MDLQNEKCPIYDMKLCVAWHVYPVVAIFHCCHDNKGRWRGEQFFSHLVSQFICNNTRRKEILESLVILHEPFDTKPSECGEFHDALRQTKNARQLGT